MFASPTQLAQHALRKRMVADLILAGSRARTLNGEFRKKRINQLFIEGT